MERDLDVKPGLKIAGCAALVVAALAIAGPTIVYVIAWGYEGHKNSKQDVGIVEFYGIVVDSEGRPIPDVKVSAELTVYSLIGGRRQKQLKEFTGSDGAFSIGPRKGIDILIHPIEKDGYEVRGRHWRFSFSPHRRENHTPDPNKPTVFTMDRKSGP